MTHKEKSRYTVLSEIGRLTLSRRREDATICYLKQFQLTDEDTNQVQFESVMIRNVAHPFVLTPLESWTDCHSRHVTVTREERGGDLGSFLRDRAVFPYKFLTEE